MIRGSAMGLVANASEELGELLDGKTRLAMIEASGRPP